MFNIETYLDSLPEDTENIYVWGKDLTYLDVTRFKNLRTLYCYNNHLTSLHLNENLHTLYCSGNQLTSLHLNEKLQELYCHDNRLTSLHLNKELKELYCYNNQLTFLQLNEKLQYLRCMNNKLTSLHLNKELKELYCSYNDFTSLQLNEELEELHCSNNPIYEIIGGINIKQKLKIVNRFRYLYYCLKYKKRFRDWLWVKIREPKIREKYSYAHLLERLHEDPDLDDLLNW